MPFADCCTQFTLVGLVSGKPGARSNVHASMCACHDNRAPLATQCSPVNSCGMARFLLTTELPDPRVEYPCNNLVML